MTGGFGGAGTVPPIFILLRRVSRRRRIGRRRCCIALRRRFLRHLLHLSSCAASSACRRHGLSLVAASGVGGGVKGLLSLAALQAGVVQVFGRLCHRLSCRRAYLCRQWTSSFYVMHGLFRHRLLFVARGPGRAVGRGRGRRVGRRRGGGCLSGGPVGVGAGAQEPGWLHQKGLLETHGRHSSDGFARSRRGETGLSA